MLVRNSISLVAAIAVMASTAGATITAMSSASAADLSVVLNDLSGAPVMDRVMVEGKETQTPLTIGKVITNSLLAPNEADKTMTGTDQAKRFMLAFRTNKDPKDIKLTTADIDLIKRLVLRTYQGPLVYGRVLEVIAPNDLGAKEE